MRSTINLRPAEMTDAALLMAWRNDAATRGASHSAATVSPAEHRQWLQAQLRNPDMQLYIAESDGMAVGTVRAVGENGVAELSWTIAPEARGRGYAKAMVAALANRITGPIRAEIKTGNMASVKVAEHAGMSFQQQSGDVLHYARTALTDPQS